MSEGKKLLGKASLAAVALATAFLPVKAAANESESQDTAEITPMYGTINPFYGSINPFYGSINPFYGSINPFYGSLDPFEGDVDPLYGSIDPFYGSLDPFYGSIDPFYGAINPFYGAIDPFYGAINPFGDSNEQFWGTINPQYGALDPFYGHLNPFYGHIVPFWEGLGVDWREIRDAWKSGASGEEIAAQMSTFVETTRGFWGEHLADRKIDFDDFAADIFARYGFDLSDPSSFESANSARRERFMLDWYDSFMLESGRDFVDHWMATANWNPALTQIQGSGKGTVIGLLDGSIGAGAKDLLDNLKWVGGYKDPTNGHGAGVASLLVADHDGEGVMGIAPSASVVAYNPFDETGTAGWEDVTDGIERLVHRGASVINLSLGVPDTVLASEWSGVFESRYVRWNLDEVVFVKAAGNSGIVQEEDIAWTDENVNLILVGSVDPFGNISKMTNSPGEACLVASNGCEPLKDRFIVAPGEMILMDDGEGGYVRRSGTSFAAPLVTGAIALLHDRWPWLRRHAEESAEIILTTATDIGEEGTDAVYGRGLLNIEASQSPIDWTNMYVLFKDGRRLKFGSLSDAAQGGDLPTWKTRHGGYVHLFEQIGDTHRDFLIPLDDSLFGKQKKLGRRFKEYYASYLMDDFLDWWDVATGAGFADVRSFGYGAGNVSVEMTSTSAFRLAEGNDIVPSHQEVAFGFNGGKSKIAVGSGFGAMAMTDTGVFNRTSDYEEGRSGLNPVNGLASGGAFVAGLHEIDPFFTVKGAVSLSKVEHDEIAGLSPEQRQAYHVLDPFKAKSIQFGMDWTPVEDLRVGATWTYLDEERSVLGVQSVNAQDFAGGSTTNAMTVDIEGDLADDLTLALSMTAAQTQTSQQAFLALEKSGALSTAFAAAVQKNGLFGNDLVRFSLSQLLHVESGSLAVTQMTVIDRATGEMGETTSRYSIADGQRPMAAELRYAAHLGSGANFALMGRADRNLNGQDGVNAFSVGAGISTRF